MHSRQAAPDANFRGKQCTEGTSKCESKPVAFKAFERMALPRTSTEPCSSMATQTVSIEDGGSWLARIRKRLTWEHTTFVYSSEVIDSTKRLYSSEAPLLAGVPLATNGVREGAFSSLQYAQVERSMLRSSKIPFTIARPEAVAASLDESSKSSGWHFSC